MDNWGRDRQNSGYQGDRYVPRNANLAPQMPGEDYKEWRCRARKELSMTLHAWERSPSPERKAAAKVSSSNGQSKARAKIPVKRPVVSDSDSSDSDSISSSSSESVVRKTSRRSSSHKHSKKHSKSSKHSKHSKHSKRRRSRSPVAPRQPDLPQVNEAPPAPFLSAEDTREAEIFRQQVQGQRDDDSDDEIGPRPMAQPKEYADNTTMDYGGALLSGEGAAIAQYVQQNMRIPRRGEIGWSGNEIEGLEEDGYVMSGSRHKRMNAVRLRKENQVYSAEEKRALALITFEEKQQKDNKVVGDFRTLLKQQLSASGFELPQNTGSDFTGTM